MREGLVKDNKLQSWGGAMHCSYIIQLSRTGRRPDVYTLYMHYTQCCATTVYSTVYDYPVRYGNTAYSRIYTVLDCIYGYGTAYGTVQTLKASVKKFELSFVSALQMAK